MANELEQRKSLAWNLLLAGKYREARDEYHYLIMDYGGGYHNIKKLRKIADVLDELEYELKSNGTKNIKKMNNFYIQLSDMANEWRELEDNAHFKALLNQISNALTATGISDLTQLQKEDVSLLSSITNYLQKSPEEDISRIDGGINDLKQIPEEDSRLTSSGIFNKIVNPKGMMHGITFCFSIFIGAIFINCLGYLYLEAQPVRFTGNDAKWGMAHRILQEWHGILELSAPVDNIILGDSTATAGAITGPVTDRLGGSTIRLGNFAQSGLLMDAWMLDQYIRRWGTPRNVLLIRTNTSYTYSHNLEIMSVVPLGWGYWDNAVPDWGKGELVDLFIKKYIVIYSNSDILSNRLLRPSKMFNQPYLKTTQSAMYSGGSTEAPDLDQFKNKASYIYSPFKPSLDSTTALEFMSNIAAKEDFNLYIIAGPEWDEIYADPARKANVSGMYNYVAQFTKSRNVHVIPDAPVQFKKELMQNPNHLRPDAARIYTEKIIDAVISTQNNTAKDNHLKIVSTKFNKSTYKTGEIPSLTVSIANDGTNEIHGAVSCSIFKSGSSEYEWISRASAVNYDLGNTRTTEIKLNVDKGEISEPGKYDVAVFVRIDEGTAFKEIKIIVPDKLEILK